LKQKFWAAHKQLEKIAERQTRRIFDEKKTAEENRQTANSSNFRRKLLEKIAERPARRIFDKNYLRKLPKCQLVELNNSSIFDENCTRKSPTEQLVEFSTKTIEEIAER
jgi:hypothetical protein